MSASDCAAAGTEQPLKQQGAAQDFSIAFQHAVDALPDESEDEESEDANGAPDPHQSSYSMADGLIGSSPDASANDNTNDNANDKVVPAAAAVRHPSGIPRPSKARTWDCRVCTFSNNPAHLLRCSMCDSRRGSSQFDAPAGSSALAGLSLSGPGTALTVPADSFSSQQQQQQQQHQPRFGTCSAHARSTKKRAAVRCSEEAPHAQPFPRPGHAEQPFPCPARLEVAEASGQVRLDCTAGPCAAQPASQSSEASETNVPRSGDAGIQGDVARPQMDSGHASEPLWTCCTCRAQLPAALGREHADSHVAADLQAQSGRSEDKWREAPLPQQSDLAAPRIAELPSTDSQQSCTGSVGFGQFAAQKRKRPSGAVTGHKRTGIEAYLRPAA